MLQYSNQNKKVIEMTLKTKAQREEEEQQFKKDFAFVLKMIQSEKESDHWYNSLHNFSPDKLIGFIQSLGYTLIGLDAKVELPAMPYIYFTFQKDGIVYNFTHNCFTYETKITLDK